MRHLVAPAGGRFNGDRDFVFGDVGLQLRVVRGGGVPRAGDTRVVVRGGADATMAGREW